MIYSKQKCLIPTLKETPNDAEIKSHILMIRAGFIRKLSAGLYTYLPLCLNVIRKIENIIREEMNNKNAQELLMPFLQPGEIWHKSGRWNTMGKEMMRIKNRQDRDFVLSPTHEEVITDLVSKEINSYKNLPCNFYQIQCKVRDEIRPRFGIIRAKEFIMKDAYSFHTSKNCLDKTYKDMYEAYTNIFKRCNLKTLAVDADTGSIGGSASTEFMALAPSGEDEVILCPKCGYAANIEKAEKCDPEKLNIEILPDPNNNELEKKDTPDKKSIEDVSRFLDIKPETMIKTLFYKADDKIICVLLRGCDQVNETKLKNYLNASEIELLDNETVEKITNAPVGFAGPVELSNIKIIADNWVYTIKQAVTGGNEKDKHYINVNIKRDCPNYERWEKTNIAMLNEGELCPKCLEEKVEKTNGIELGHIFKLGTKYSESLDAKFLDQNGKSQTMIMGCYGIGVSRMVSAIIEQHNDEVGITWPVSVAPLDICLLPVNTNDNEVMELSYKLYEDLKQNGFTVLLDDRNERPGFKFKDADLIGLPIRIIVSSKNLKQGLLEIKIRKTGEIFTVEKQNIMNIIKEQYDKLLKEEN